MSRGIRHITALCLLMFYSVSLHAQQQGGREVVERKIEELSARYDLSIDYSDQVDVLYYYYRHPLNLNAATRWQLQSLGFFNTIQVDNLLSFRKQYGYLRSVYELKDIPGFDLDFIRDILMFVTVEPVYVSGRFDLPSALKYGRNDLFLRYGRIIEPQAGYAPISDSAIQAKPNARYLGSPDKLYLRYRYTWKDMLSVGLVADKDAGEEFFKGSNPRGFDFYSFHLFARNIGVLKAVALGDYHLQFGQGLTLWSGVGFGKSSQVMDVQKNARGLRPNTSANENAFMRGAAAMVALGQWSALTVFYSKHGLDASLHSDTLSAEDAYFSSIQESGMHRTPSEVEKKNTVMEQVAGANFSFGKKGLHFGATAYKTLYDRELKKAPALYQLYDFRGRDNFNAGVDFSWTRRRYALFGELAFSQNGGMAMLTGLIADLMPRFKMSLLYRRFDVDYQVFHAIPFAEASGAKNEEGLYIGAKFFVGENAVLKSYYDLFSFPWLRYRVNAPSQGQEFLLQYEQYPTRHLSYYLRFKSETKMLNNSVISEGLVAPTPVLKQSIRAHLSYSPGEGVVLKSRVELADYRHQPEALKYGYLLYQDLQYRPDKLPFDISLRYALMNTDYDTRIYAYENDVLYKFSVPGYFYKGQRFYILLHYDLARHIDLWLRLSRWSYIDRKSIGTGLESIDGTRKTEFTAQLRWKF